MALPALALWGLTAGGAVEPWMVFALVFVRGSVNAVDNPTRQSFVTEMVGSERVVNAVGLNSALIHAARIFGPAGAGVMIATVGVAPCFLLNSLTFAAMIVALRAMDPRQLEPGSGRGPRSRGALRATPAPRRRDPGAGGAAGDDGAGRDARLQLPGDPAGAGASSPSAAAPPPTRLLAIAMAVGALAGSLVHRRPHAGRLAADLIGVGARLRRARRSPPPWRRRLALTALVLVPLGAASVAFAAGTNAKLQLTAEPSMRGRVMALYSMVFLGSTPIGGPIAGWLSRRASPRAALLLTAVAALAAGAGADIVWLRARAAAGAGARAGRGRG